MDPCGTVMVDDGPEDILSVSLQSLYDFSPITFAAAGSLFTYPIRPGRVPHPPPLDQIEVATPDTDPSNWSLHASSIWVSSLFLADHLEELHIDAIAQSRAASADPEGTDTDVRILELGAGAGLPSILLASMYQERNVSVVVSDYPDDRLIRTLSDNVRRNKVSERCRAVPYAWGTDTRVLTPRSGDERDARFDIVFAADTLWNPEIHAPFLDTLCMCLKRDPDARVHLVAGLHTGRYTIQSFLDGTQLQGIVLQSAIEREVCGTQSRPWDVSRAEGEDERERRRWVVWIVLKWKDPGGHVETIVTCTK